MTFYLNFAKCKLHEGNNADYIDYCRLLFIAVDYYQLQSRCVSNRNIHKFTQAFTQGTCHIRPILNTFKNSRHVVVKALIIQSHKTSSHVMRIIYCGITERNYKVSNYFRKFATVSKGDNTCNLPGTSKFEFFNYVCFVYSVSDS